MTSRSSFLKSGHTPTLFSAFLYFDLSFMVWVLLGSLGVAIAKDFGLSPAEKGFMVAVPTLVGALLRLVNGVLVDHIGPRKTGLLNQAIVLCGLGLAWFLGVHDYGQVLLLGVLLGGVSTWFAQGHHRRREKHWRREAHLLNGELETLRKSQGQTLGPLAEVDDVLELR